MSNAMGRYLYAPTLALGKWRPALLLAMAAVLVAIAVCTIALPKTPAVLQVNPVMVLLVMLVVLVDQELVVDHEAITCTFSIVGARRLCWRTAIRWEDQPSVVFRRLALGARSARFNVLAQVTRTAGFGRRWQHRPLALMLHQWVHENDVQAYRQHKSTAKWWRLGHDRIAYSDAPQIFALGAVFRERGYDPLHFASSPLLTEIDLAKAAVKWPLLVGLLSVLLAIALAWSSEWLYVESWLGWAVAGATATVAAVAIVTWGMCTRCDASSVIGATVAGASGLALLAAIAAPDVSALLHGTNTPQLFSPKEDGSWQSDNGGPVNVLPEPPVRALREPTMVHVACGVPRVCAFKRTDFRY